jgi:hypothetical protein
VDNYIKAMANLPFIQQLLSTIQQKKPGDGNVPPPQLPTMLPPEVPDTPPPPPIGQYGGLLQSIHELPANGVGLPDYTPSPIAQAPVMDAPAPTMAPATSATVPVPQVPTDALLSPRQRLGHEISDIENKQYQPGIYRNPQTGATTHNPKKPGFTEVVQAPGANRSKKWSFGEKLGGALLGWATHGLAGGIEGATDRNYFKKLGDERQLSHLLPAYDRQRAMDEYDTTEAYKKAQTATIPIDDAQKAADAVTRANEFKLRQQNMALARINKLPVFDPKNPAHAQIAKEAGLDPSQMEGWDNRNPLIRKVGDTTYKLDRATGEFTPTNLPKDEEKKLVRFDVVNPETKQTETYNILEKDAARFRVQQEQQGKAIQARQAMQSNQQQFTLKHDQIAQQLKKELEDYKTADAEIKATKDQARKLELQKANEERQKNILKYKTDLESSLLNDQ